MITNLVKFCSLKTLVIHCDWVLGYLSREDQYVTNMMYILDVLLL
jgi:hypothetical protein